MQELARLTKSFGAMHGWVLNCTGTVLLVKTCWFGPVLTGFSACVAFPRLKIQVMGSASFVGAMRLHDFVSDLVEAPTRNVWTNASTYISLYILYQVRIYCMAAVSKIHGRFKD